MTEVKGVRNHTKWTSKLKCLSTCLLLIIVAEGAEEKSQYWQRRRARSCTYGCVYCQGMNGCIQCKEGLFLYIQDYGRRQRGICVYRCPVGFYGDRSRKSSHCKKCSKKFCGECFDDTYCSECLYPTYRYRGKCVFLCPPGLDRDENYRECVPKRDCKLSRWARWSDCKPHDGKPECSRVGVSRGGIKIKSRYVIQYPSISGKKCNKLKKTKPCHLRRCMAGNKKRTIFDRAVNSTAIYPKIENRASTSQGSYSSTLDTNKTEA